MLGKGKGKGKGLHAAAGRAVTSKSPPISTGTMSAAPTSLPIVTRRTSLSGSGPHMVSDYDDQPTWSVARLGTLTPPVVPWRDGRKVGVAVGACIRGGRRGVPTVGRSRQPGQPARGRRPALTAASVRDSIARMIAAMSDWPWPSAAVSA